MRCTTVRRSSHGAAQAGGHFACVDTCQRLPRPDHINAGWLEQFSLGQAAPQDVETKLAEFSARTIANAVEQYCPQADELYVCGGGAHNLAVLERLRRNLPQCRIATTAALGMAPDWVEAIAFAWLAKETVDGRPGNLPAVTGAGGKRVLGAIYPA